MALDVLINPLTSEEIAKNLIEIMLKPLKMFGFEPHRPAEIHFEDEKMAEAVQPLLESSQVKVLYQPQREAMDQLIKELEKSLPDGEGADFPGLLKQRGVKPELVGSLFAAALKFYRAEPWVQLTNDDLLSVQVNPQKEPYFVIVMGNGGEEYGLSVFRSWEELVSFFGAAHPLEAVPREGRHAFMYNEPPYVSIDDLDAIETYGWELPAPDLIPTPALYLADRVKRPDVAMLRWYEAALQAIPEFVAQVLKTNPDGTHPDAEMDTQVQTSAGKKQVHIRYPGGDLSSIENRLPFRMDLLDEEDDDLEDDDLLDFPMIDQRGMEGLMAQLSEEIGAVSPVSDPALDEAQQIMYDAWDARSPKQRIALAKKALKTSPDCADAYVLLAEEEAETAKEKVELYRQGVEAGRRALGEEFINDPQNIGSFWGILETRPLMRAMGGLATALWGEKHLDEAEKLFREILRLNPNDNQGIRYLLLGLLMEQGQDDAARTLLEAYEGDWSADWTYTTALLSFKEKGDSVEAKLALQQALQVNQHVPKYLTGKKKLPAYDPDMITMGGDDEAVYYARGHLNDWRKTPGAVEWLRVNSKV